MRQDLLEECVAYFRARPVYRKVFRQLQKKYASLGHFGGKLILGRLTEEEREQLQGFLCIDLSRESEVTISYAQMKKTLAASRYAELSWEEIAEAYLSEKLTKDQDVREKKRQERDLFFQGILQNYKMQVSPLAAWMEALLADRDMDGHKYIMRLYREDRSGLLDLLGHLDQMVRHLPAAEGKECTLPVFAAQQLGNPHGLDYGMPDSKGLFCYLEWKFQDVAKSGMTGVEYRQMLFLRAGILVDDLSNSCMVYGIHAEKKEGGVHAGMEGFCQERQPVLLTLKTLNGLAVLSLEPEAENQLFAVENPAVFNHLINRYPERAFLCGNGQLRLAVLRTLDLLQEDIQIFYAGDFDPEGLVIAQRLWERYGEKVSFWEYREEHYRNYLSDQELDDGRLRSLRKVQAPGLQEVKQAMMKGKRATYQEAMLEKYRLS